ncbi:mCG147602 [Mus musculus]|nr:mCG147602 [Mus musculus]
MSAGPLMRPTKRRRHPAAMRLVLRTSDWDLKTSPPAQRFKRRPHKAKNTF